MNVRLHYTVVIYLLNQNRPIMQFTGFFDNAGKAINAALSKLSDVELLYVSRVEVTTKEVRVKK